MASHGRQTSRGRDGMVDISDLKSVGRIGRVGSSPTARTKSLLERFNVTLFFG